MNHSHKKFQRHVSLWRKINAVVWLLPAWFAPHYKLRVFFHRLRGVNIVGKNVFIGYYCTLDNVHPEYITIEDNVAIGANTVVISHDDYSGIALNNFESNIKPVVFKKFAAVGIGCMVMPGVTLGENSVVGAFSYVHTDVPANTLCVMPRKPFKIELPPRGEAVEY